MSNLSSETLFHFTQEYDTLVSIINNGFYPRYCIEKFSAYEIANNTAIPMICFCDIPLSKANFHMNDYGKYALGMKKEWAIKSGISPVFYTTDKGLCYKRIYDIFGFLLDEFMENPLGQTAEICKNIESLGGVEIPEKINSRIKLEQLNKKLPSIIGAIIDTKYNTKPIEGISNKTGKLKKFYDEKEWRLIPIIEESLGKFSSINEYQFSDSKFSEENKKIEKYALKFDYTDIEYIIVEDDSKREDIISALKKHFNTPDGENYINSQKIIILTPEQINNDF
jgi:hypothetical protein